MKAELPFAIRSRQHIIRFCDVFVERFLAALACRRREPLPFAHSLYQTSRPAGGAPRSILVVDAARSVNGF